MPTVVRKGNIRIAVLTRNEHEPPHVHIEHPDGIVVVWLDEEKGFARLRESSRRVKAGDVRAILDLIEMHFDELLAAWKRYHR